MKPICHFVFNLKLSNWNGPGEDVAYHMQFIFQAKRRGSFGMWMKFSESLIPLVTKQLVFLLEF